MRAPHLVLPLVLALTSLGTGAAGVLAAADIRADERRERAAAAERRAEQREREAVARYQEALTPVAVAVYDAVQPLQQAYADLEDGDVSAVDVLLDVSNQLVSEQGLPALETRLAAVTPAASVEEDHELLKAALKDFTAAARIIAPLRDSEGATVGADVIADGDLALDAATRDWTRPLTPIYLGVTAPVVPVEAGTDGRRVPLSHASYLRDAGNLCSSGIDAFDKSGSSKADPSIEEIRAGLRELGKWVPRIAAVNATPADEALVASSIRAPLERTLELVEGFERAVAAARRGDGPAVRQAEAQIARGEVAAEKAAAGLRAYGSELCALYLVGLEEDSAVGGDDPTRRA